MRRLLRGIVQELFAFLGAFHPAHSRNLHLDFTIDLVVESVLFEARLSYLLHATNLLLEQSLVAGRLRFFHLVALDFAHALMDRLHVFSKPAKLSFLLSERLLDAVADSFEDVLPGGHIIVELRREMRHRPVRGL